MSGAGLLPGEEEWREPFDRLIERFPAAGEDRVAEALRQHKGHAGKAASYLREILSANVKEQDPNDAEHVKTLLSSPFMFKHSCREHFEKFDFERSGSLDLDEITQLTTALYSSFGLEPPSEGSVRAYFVAMDENGDGVLSEHEFQTFFEKFLRLAHFDVKQLRELVQEGEAKAGSRCSTPAGKKSSHRHPRSSSLSSSCAPTSAGEPTSASEEERLAAEKLERRRRRKAHRSSTPAGERDQECERGCTPSNRSSSTPAGHHRSRHHLSGTPGSHGRLSDASRLRESPSRSRLRPSRHADDDWKCESFKASASFAALSATGGLRKGVDYSAGSTKYLLPV